MVVHKPKSQGVGMLCVVVLIVLTISVANAQPSPNANAQLTPKCQKHIDEALETLDIEEKGLETDYFGTSQDRLSQFTEAERSKLIDECLSFPIPVIPYTEECGRQFIKVLNTLKEANRKIQREGISSLEVIESPRKQYQLLRTKCSTP